jgi:hypothetical protein
MLPTNPFLTYDYLQEARDRVTEQFKDKEVFDKYLQLMLYANIELQEVFKDLMQKRSLDTAVGAQLDIIGDIVGQPRELIDTALIEYFAFDGYPDAQSYGDLNDGSVGGFYYSFGDPLAGNTLLNDDQYRLFIKAKIIKNNTQATPDQFLDFVSFVFGATVNNVVAEGNASFTLMVGKELNSFEKALLTYTSTYNGYASPFVPKPIGVRVNFGQFDFENYFGFQGTPNAKGYGDLSDPSVGGKYAQLF